MWESAHPIGSLLADASQYLGGEFFVLDVVRGSVGNSYRMGSFLVG